MDNIFLLATCMRNGFELELRKVTIIAAWEQLPACMGESWPID
jgi:hypothetical protein